jgi:2-dehydro-3-deoxygluconokinase
MTRVAVIGECMIELSHLDDATLALAYAGDTLNMALHLARWGREAGIEVDYVTRLGDDHHSDAMVAGWEREGIGTGLVDRIAGCAPGLYLIRVDAAGERTFTYWRSASPARRLLADDAHAGVLQAGLEDADWVYLSGITLSLLGGDAHGRLLALLDALRLRGTRVAFDTNFRPAAWDSPATARARCEDLLARTDLALPTFEDEAALFGDRDLAACLERLATAGVGEAAVKLGADGAVAAADGAVDHVAAEPGLEVVDSTGAGDAFNAGYLQARLRGHAPPGAARAGNRLAAAAIGHRGAIVPADAMPDGPGPPVVGAAGFTHRD